MERYRGDFKVQSFSCLDQFLCLAFAQLSYRESLRDIEACLRAMEPRFKLLRQEPIPHSPRTLLFLEKK